jgi:hypothetical protein
VRRPLFAYGPDAYDQPPDTDPAPVPCTNCGRTDCDCGSEPDRDDATETEVRNDAR